MGYCASIPFGAVMQPKEEDSRIVEYREVAS